MLIPLLAKAQLNADGVISIGRNALYYEDYALSIQYFNQVIEAKPYLYEPYFFRGVAKYYLGDYMGASNDCSLAIERNPFVDNIYKLRAISFVMNGEYEKAATDYKHLTKMCRHDQDVWYNLVLCETQQKHLETADTLLDTMIVKWPQSARCYMLKAQIALEHKDSVLADTLIRQTLNINPFNVDALGAMAMLQMQRGEYEQAEATYDRAILQAPRKAGFYINRALSRFHRKNLRGAMDDYDIALDIEPDNYLGHYNRGLLRMQVGEDNLSIEDFNFVLKKEPRDRLALFNRATLNEKTGDYKGAVRDYTTVLEDYPNFIVGYENRARCRRLAGDEKGAIADERKVTIARLDDMYGNKKKKPVEKDTRKQKEQNIDDYKKMVVENDEESIAKFYESDYRGKIQNREVAVELQPVYIFTFNREGNGVASLKNYADFLEKLNDEKLFDKQLYLSTREGASSADDIKQMDMARNELQTRLENDSRNSHLLFAHGFYSAGRRDYAEALADLNQAVSSDSTFMPTYFLRAVVKLKQIEMKQFKAGTTETADKTMITQQMQMDYLPILEDLNRAIQLAPSVSYLYYNRGCVNARMGRQEEAVKDFDTAIGMNTSLAEAYYNRALLTVEKNNKQQAFSDLGKAGELGLYSAYSLIKHFRKQMHSETKAKK